MVSPSRRRTKLIFFLNQVLELLDLKGVKDTKIGDEVWCTLLLVVKAR